MSKPRPVIVDDLRAIPQRAPTSRNPNWSWRCRRNGELLLSGRMSRDEVRKRLARILLEEPAEEAEAARIETVGMMMDAWFTNDIQGQRTGWTERTYRSSARRVRRLVGDLQVDRGERVLRIMLDKMRGNFAPKTVELTQKVLLAAWAWSFDRAHVNTKPPKPVRLKVTQARKVIPTLDQALEVIEAIAEPYRSVLLVQLATGARIGEICELRADDITIEAGRPVLRLGVHDEAQKTGERRVPVTSPYAARELRRVLAEARLQRRDRLWVGKLGGRVTPSKVSVRLRHLDWSSHALRHLAVLQMRRAGVQVEVAAALLGHSVTVMLNAYRQIEDGELVDAMERVRLGESSGVRGV